MSYLLFSTVCSFGQVATGTVGSCRWAFYEDGRLTIDGSGSMGTTVPSYQDSYQSKIKKVEIGEDVTTICTDAFYSCKNLESVTFKGSSKLTTIGPYAFSNSSLASFPFSSCPQLEKIEENAFRESRMTDPDLSSCSKLKTIEKLAFFTGRLKTVLLPATLKTIGDDAFENYNGTSLSFEIVDLREQVDKVGNVFSSDIKESAKVYVVSEEVKDKYVDGGFKKDNIILIPQKLANGFSWALDSSNGTLTISKSNETSATFPTHPRYPWCFCKNQIKKVVWSEYAINIPSLAFDGCENLTELTNIGSVTSFGDYAFRNTSIAHLKIPAGVTSLGAWGTSRIANVTVSENNKNYTSRSEGGNELNLVMTSDGKRLLFCPAVAANVLLPKTLTEVADNAFAGKVGKLVIPASVSDMDSWPTSATAIYASNASFLAADLPSQLKSVKVYASSAAVKNKYESLGFTNVETGESCDESVSYFLENGVLTIVGSGAVTSHPWNSDETEAAQIKRVVVEPGITKFSSEAFANCVNLMSITLPEGFYSIGSNTFAGCTSLTSVAFPSSMSYIAESLGKSCLNSGIKSVKVADGGDFSSKNPKGEETNILYSLSDKSLSYSPSADLLDFYSEVLPYCIATQSVGDFNIPENIKGISENAFSNLSIKNIYCASTAWIPASAFSEAVKGKAKVYVSTEAVKTKFVNAGFTESNIKVATGKCGDAYYYAATKTKLVIFGGGKIYSPDGDWPTAGNFTTVQFVGNAFTEISDFAFASLTGLKGKLTIPSSISSIGVKAFGSTKITGVICDSKVPADLSETAFTTEAFETAKLIVPDSAREAYSQAIGWDNFGVIHINEELVNPCDVNNDGIVNSTDISIVKKNAR
ncbi:MAG: leucine-rich repeat protein [Paludibacteraceae bacterium]|nr:leucine-rich repeat protein [Paludibacteraceae bacterium]